MLYYHWLFDAQAYKSKRLHYEYSEIIVNLSRKNSISFSIHIPTKGAMNNVKTRNTLKWFYFLFRDNLSICPLSKTKGRLNYILK